MAICTTYDAGSRRDGRLIGAAALVQHMLQDGGRSTSGADYSRQIEARGGRLENQLTADFARFCTLVPKHELELGLWLEAGRMTEYAFNQPNFDKRSSALQGEYLDAMQGSVYSRGLRRLNEIAFERDEAYEHVAPPSPSDLERLTLADARDFHRTFYRSNNAVLTIAGDFDAFEVLDLVKRHLGAPGASGLVPRAATDIAPPQQSPRLSVLIEPTAKGTAAFYAWVIPSSTDGDHPALSVLNTLLGGGSTSLLYEQIVTKEHLATQVDAWTAGHAGPDLFALRVEGKESSRLDLIDRRLNEVLARVAQGAPVPSSVLEAAKRRVIHARLEQLSSNLGRAQYLGELELRAQGAAPEVELAGIEAVTAEDVRRVVREHLTPARRTSIEIYPKEWQDPNQAAMPKFHIVSSGENLTLIAKRYGSTVPAICKMNGIGEKQPIFPGQKLRVPHGVARKSPNTKNSSSPKQAAPAQKKKKEAIAYQVKKGDSLSSIAARHNISVAALLRANRIDPKKPLQIGQRLAIPVP